MSLLLSYSRFVRLIGIVLLLMLFLNSQAQSLEKLEYFIDKDPGVGKATSVSFSGPKDTILKTFSIPTSGLSFGHHYVHVRVLDSGGLWSPWQFQMFHVQDTINLGKINKVEYFVGKDPGVSKATAQTISTGDTVKTQINQSISALSSGFHFIHVRAKIDHGYWSPWQVQMFHVQDTIQTGKISNIEYFVGKDPGIAKGVAQSITVGDSVKTLISQSTSSLKQGFNFIHVRAKIEHGYWSPWQLQLFHVQDTLQPGPINKIEYFVGKDPGVAKAINHSITAGDTVKSLISQSTSSLNLGFNFIHVRAKIANGHWSPWQLQMFHVQDTTQPGPVNAVEYFVDKDPGAGKATNISFTAADTVKKQFLYNSASLSRGQHFMHVRAKNRYGYWSPYQFQMFFVESPNDTAKIVSYKYSIDSSLQKLAYVKTFKISPPADTFKRTHFEKTDTALKYGNHYFRIWAQVSNRFSSTWHRDTFAVIDCPMLDTAVIAKFGRLCKGDTLLFRQDITKLGVWSRDSFNFRWLVNGTQLSTADSFKYRHNSGDTFRLRFSFTRKRDARCKGSLEQTIRIFNTPRDTFRSTICSGDSIRIHGTQRKSAGTYNFSGTSKVGCDSFSTVILSVKPSYKDTLRREICAGDSLNIHGTFRKTASVYILNATTKLGCDSIVTLILKVNPVYRKTDTIAICKGDTLKIHGKRYLTAGTYRDSFKTTKGCDSIFSTRVIVNPTYNDSSTRSICSGDSSLIHGTWRKTAGSYKLSGKTVRGCDSFSTVILKIKPVYKYTLNPEICAGDSQKVHGIFRKTSGTYILNGKTYLGCDSIVTTNLKVNPVYRKTDTFTICNGDTLKVHGKRYTKASIYRDSFKTTKGCDSLFNTQLIVNPTYNLTQKRGLCGGDSFLFAGLWRKVTGSYVGKFTTKKGCDSTVTLNLTVDSIIRSDDFPQICLGDSMKVGGLWRKTAGIYTDIYTAFRGCDSAVSRHLSIIPRDTTYLTTTICQRGSLKFHGQAISDTGNYKAILRNRRGCDSVLFLRVFKREENRTIFSGQVCHGEGFFAGKSIKFGTGTFFDTLTDRFGCDSIVIYTQTERERDTTALSFSICAGDSIFTGNSWKRTAGKYSEILKNRFGCDSTVKTDIQIRATSFTSILDTICFGKAYNFFGSAATFPGIYRKTLVNHVGCDSIVELHLFRRAQFIPSVISLSFAVLGTDKPYQTYQWYKNRNVIAGATNDTLTVGSSGIYDVSVTDSLGCGANSWDDILNNHGFEMDAPIRIFPNPANHLFYVQSAFAAEIDIFNSTGVHIVSQKLNPDLNTISASNWPEGVYQVRFRLHQFVYSTTIVVLH